MSSIVIRRFAQQRDLLPTIRSWFEEEWPRYYGANGPGNAEQDLQAYANAGGVPLGLVAFKKGTPCGFVALKGEAFPTHPHLAPWVGAAYVQPPLRRQGIGRALFLAIEPEARTLGYASIYCATGTSASLLLRCGWHLLQSVHHEGQQLGVYEKAL